MRSPEEPLEVPIPPTERRIAPEILGHVQSANAAINSLRDNEERTRIERNKASIISEIDICIANINTFSPQEFDQLLTDFTCLRDEVTATQSFEQLHEISQKFKVLRNSFIDECSKHNRESRDEVTQSFEAIEFNTDTITKNWRYPSPPQNEYLLHHSQLPNHIDFYVLKEGINVSFKICYYGLTVAEIFFSTREDQRNMNHRLVQSQSLGINGTHLLKKSEQFMSILRKANVISEETYLIDAGQWTVIEWALRNGYTFQSPEEEKRYYQIIQNGIEGYNKDGTIGGKKNYIVHAQLQNGRIQEVRFRLVKPIQ